MGGAISFFCTFIVPSPLPCPSAGFLRMPCGPSATRRLQIENGAKRKRKMHRRRWRPRKSCAKAGWSRWLSRNTRWRFRCSGTEMSSRGSFGRRGTQNPDFLLLWKGEQSVLRGLCVLDGRALSAMLTSKGTSILIMLPQSF